MCIIAVCYTWHNFAKKINNKKSIINWCNVCLVCQILVSRRISLACIEACSAFKPNPCTGLYENKPGFYPRLYGISFLVCTGCRFDASVRSLAYLAVFTFSNSQVKLVYVSVSIPMCFKVPDKHRVWDLFCGDKADLGARFGSTHLQISDQAGNLDGVLPKALQITFTCDLLILHQVTDLLLHLAI